MIERWRAEAERAWRSAARARRWPSLAERALLAAVAVASALAFAAIAARLALLGEVPGAIPVLGAALALLFAVGPWIAWRAARRRAERDLGRARARRVGLRCPRCEAPLLAHDSEHAGERDCGACGGRLIEARGLAIAGASDPEVREARWRAQALARIAPSPPPWSCSGRLWLAGAALGIGGLWGCAAAVSGPGALRAPLGYVREVPRLSAPRSAEGRASAAAEAELPSGRATRPLAPLWVGTQVLARKGDGSAWHHLAVIVRARGGEAFVVYADGDSDWVERRGILAPELARDDVIEVWDGARWVPARVRERVGPALRLEGSGAEWTSAARVRVRVDAPHERGQGRRYEIPPGAWVEARLGEVWRPGLAVDQARRRLFVALSDGTRRWFHEDDVRAQQLGPGARVYLDGEPGTRIVAARIGHALAVVDDQGRRGWTSLARVRRVRAP